MKKSSFCFFGCLACVLLSMVLVNYHERLGEYAGGVVAVLCLIAFVIFLPAGFVFRAIEKHKAYKSLPPERREEIDADKERKREDARIKMEMEQERAERRKADRTIVSTAIVNSTTIGTQKSSMKSSVVRGAVGSLIHPVIGIAGAVTPTKTTTTKTTDVTFSVRYASGRCKLEKVKFGSARYKELAKYLA